MPEPGRERVMGQRLDVRQRDRSTCRIPERAAGGLGCEVGAPLRPSATAGVLVYRSGWGSAKWLQEGDHGDRRLNL